MTNRTIPKENQTLSELGLSCFDRTDPDHPDYDGRDTEPLPTVTLEEQLYMRLRHLQAIVRCPDVLMAAACRLYLKRHGGE